MVEVPSRLRLRRFLVLAGLLIWRDPLPFSAVPPSLSVGVVQSVQSPLGRGQYSETVGSLMDGGLPDLTHIDVPLDPAVPSETDRYRPITIFNIAEVAEKHPRLAPCVDDIRLSSLVFPFKASPYVVEELIDWQREGSITDDPFYRLIFPTMAMLSSEHQARLREAQEEPMELKAVVAQIRRELNPHPAVQKELNAPKEDRLTGVQQKYESPVLFFPAAAQTCQACFRWTQFIGDSDLKFAQNDAEDLFSYLKTHSVTDVLFTGGDPMIMKTRFLRKYLEPFKTPKLCGTVPGVMSATPGKVEVTGVEEVIQCQDESWIGPKYDHAIWFDVEPLNGMYLPWDKQGLPMPSFYLPSAGLATSWPCGIRRNEETSAAGQMSSISCLDWQKLCQAVMYSQYYREGDRKSPVVLPVLLLVVLCWTFVAPYRYVWITSHHWYLRANSKVFFPKKGLLFKNFGAFENEKKSIWKSLSFSSLVAIR